MKQHFYRNWWKYLAVILLPVILWSTVFFLRSKPKRNEILRVLYVGKGLNTEELQNDLAERFPQMKEITVTQELPQSFLGGDWMTYRQFEYDLLIFDESYCTETMGQQYFSRLPDTLLSRFPNVPTYVETVDGRSLTYALRLDGGKTNFANYCNTEKACLLFFSPESVNLGGENRKGNAADTAAIIAAQYLSEEID